MKDIAFMTNGPKRLAERAERCGVWRVRVDDAVHIRACFINLRMDKDLGVTLIFTLDLFAAQVDDDDVLGTNLFETKTMRLHEDSLLSGNANRHMTQDIVPVAFISKNVAGISQRFL